MTDDRIKPCPFCGSLALNFVEGSTFRWLVAECQSCGARCGETRVKTLGDPDPDSDRATALAEWNRRAIEAECRVPEVKFSAYVYAGKVRFSVEQQSFTLDYSPDTPEELYWMRDRLDAALSKIAAAPKPAEPDQLKSEPVAEPDCECGAVASEHCPACEPAAQFISAQELTGREFAAVLNAHREELYEGEPVAQEPVAWREFDGEGGYDYRSYDGNENFRDEYRKRNQQPTYRNWVEPLYLHPQPVAQEPVSFYIYKETAFRLGIPNVLVDSLPWVYDQDPSSGFTARLKVYLAPPDRYALNSLDLIAAREHAAAVEQQLIDAQERIAELEVTIEAQRTLYANCTKIANENDELRRQQAGLVEALESVKRGVTPEVRAALASVKGVTFPPHPGESVPADLKVTEK